MLAEKILVIEDDEASGRLIRSVLSSKGMNVLLVETGKMGLIVQEEKEAGVIFLSLDIIDLDVRYLLRELKDRDPDTAIILTSKGLTPMLVQEAITWNAADYMVKPLQPEEIYFKARKALEHRTFVRTNTSSMQGVEERSISLQKQNIMLARRIHESAKNLSKLYEDLRETYLRTIKALAHSIDARDHYHYSHSDNVTRYVEMLCRCLNVEGQDTSDILDASELHDVGKIGVHDGLLSKSTELTPEDRKEIEIHASKGAQILEPLSFLGNVIDIVCHHHERWDGKGYPDGLSGEQIPLGARILAVADAYDAMVSSRPYRKVSLTKEAALAELKKNSGSQFDPRIVESFLKLADSLDTASV